MQKLMVDTNVLFDYFALRHPSDKAARLLLFGCACGDYEMWISSSQITDLFYLLTHGDERRDVADATRTLVELRRHVRVATLTEGDVDEALAHEWDDFVDACVFVVARRNKANVIVTRNKKDFERSPIPAMTPEEFLQSLEETEGITYAEAEL